jgi:hypothetical protein
LFVKVSAEFGIPVQVFLLMHPFLERLGHLVRIVVVVLAVERLAYIDPDLLSLKTVKRMRVL